MGAAGAADAALARYLLRFAGSAEPPRPHHLHGAVSAWLGDEEEDALSPHNGPAKAWSAWWTPQTDGGVLEVGVARPALAQRLLRRARDDGRLRLGEAVLTLREASAGPDSAAPWTRLVCEPGSAPRLLAVRYLTATTLRHGKSTTPWVDPGSLFVSLAARWNTLAPAGIPRLEATPAERATLWVSRVAGRTEVLRLANQRIVPGFVGEVTYRGDEEVVLARFASLLRMAEYLGAGARTTYGFGRMRLL
ncbi:hypothetical protein GCM10010921_08710 [Microbacterium album]|uniref:CRISPR-associated protein Cas6 C-terminal domain-containing protein n=1 Tax=Microbacterium album TaxID=2053191 RepID=A0A917ICB9_9MICO|nr:hypothetical protein GCM10010921_08710 [Microbacterium album]